MPIKSAVRCNLLEDNGDAVKVAGNVVELDVKPYEVVGVKLRG